MTRPPVTYLFDPADLHAIARTHIGTAPIEAVVQSIHGDLRERYPRHIQPRLEWVFSNAGGAMGAFAILHASLSEYVIVFGTPIGTEGHTGRFFADDYFIILEGEQWAFDAGSYERRVFRPAELHHLERRQARGYRVPERCWALEYVRGWVPLMLPFGVADVLTSTLDFSTLLRTFRLYGRSVARSLARGKV